MELHLVNDKPKYRPPKLAEPPLSGFLVVSADVEPPGERSPLPGRGEQKDALLGRLRKQAAELERMDTVRRANVYRAALAPPVSGYAKTAEHPARYDVIALVETTSPEAIAEVEASVPGKEILGDLGDSARRVAVASARAVKRIGSVERPRDGVFLFNHFVAEDVDVALELWDHLAGWFMTETGIDNSLVLRPTGHADYDFVNYARLPYGIPRWMLRQMTKPSFFRYVTANLRRHQVGPMPVLCRPA